MSDAIGGRVTGSDAEGPVTVPEGTGAVPCDAAPCGAAPCGVSLSDAAPCNTALGGVAPCCVSLPDSAPCSAAPCKAQGTAAEVESEVMGDGDMTFLAASAAGGMSGRVSPTVFAGVGDDGSSAPSRSRFLAEYVGGTGMEAAVAWRNSANASSRILTRASMVDNVLARTRREQHAVWSRKKRRRLRDGSRAARADARGPS